MPNSTLLPNNSTQQETAIELSCARLFNVPVETIKTWNPEECPESFLPWLAFAMGVGTWNANWDADKKREAIKISMDVQKKKGSAAAIKTGLEKLGYLLQVIEWFDEAPPADPFTFRLLINGQYEPITPSLFEDISRIIQETKNARSHLSKITVTRNILGPVYIPMGLCSGVSSRVFPLQIVSLNSEGQMAVALGQYVADFVSVFPN